MRGSDVPALNVLLSSSEQPLEFLLRGLRFFVVSRFELNHEGREEHEGRNSMRWEDYHRMDQTTQLNHER